MSALRTARHIARVKPEKATLFICDAQERLRKAMPEFDDVCRKIAMLHNGTRHLNIPTRVTEHVPTKLGNTYPLIWHPFEKPEDFPSTGENQFKLMTKTNFSMLNEEMSSSLDPERNQVIITGMETHVCILQTSLDLLAAGYEVFVVADAVSSQRPHDRTVALSRIANEGGVLTTSESLLLELLGSVDHPKFKNFMGDTFNLFGKQLRDSFSDRTTV